ncbi:heterokaryon incompatibility protein-domain-containing protein [Apodospora peruviana]|uniref:Heterokaryon incompatibility protein-domain-containing protein n=1 Tax=Apodospora peruviana TaxID=516989 RepID=A0AAE0HSA1_9PEZI|nr:heterokaryon incompatibility protein-domain-containing protein [Apodospora peruviana]
MKPQPSPLCATCEQIFTAAKKDLEVFSPYIQHGSLKAVRTIGDIFAHADEGCHFCLLQRRIFQQQDHVAEAAGSPVDVEWEKGGSVRDDYTSVRFGLTIKTDDLGLFACFYMTPVPRNRLGSRATSAASEPTNASRNSLALAQRWIENCVAHHGKCSIVKESLGAVSWLPTRLLDVSASLLRLRLKEEATEATGVEYMTLSHCWGSGMPFQLTSNTWDSLRQGIDKSALPQTFQDAVDITQLLGVKYLWIDCLCIRQDSPEDWKAESVLMDKVYEQSWCNIAAAKADDSAGGCFATGRDLSAITPCVVTWTPPRKPGSKKEQKEEYLYCLPEQDVWKDSLESCRLFTRGWVLQERTLARRSLCFDKDQMFWECHEHRASEGLPHGVLMRRKKQTEGMPWSSVSYHAGYNPPKLSVSDLTVQNRRVVISDGHYLDDSFNRYFVWNDFVETYTRCQLTFPDKDKLVAISAIARRLGPPRDYLAGLWRPMLPSQLLWHDAARVTTNDEEYPSGLTRSPACRTPSWSWASVNGLVTMAQPMPGDSKRGFASVRCMINITKAHVTQSNLAGDAFGTVDGGVIQLQGHLVKAALRKHEGSSSNDGRHWLGKCRVMVAPDEGDIIHGKVYYYLPIYRTSNMYVSGDAVSGLMLAPTGTKAGQYRRAGKFDVEVYDYDVDFIGMFMEKLKSPLDKADFEEYLGETEDGQRRFLIEVV